MAVSTFDTCCLYSLQLSAFSIQARAAHRLPVVASADLALSTNLARLRAFARSGISFREPLRSPVKAHLAQQALGELAHCLAQTAPVLASVRFVGLKTASARSKARVTRHLLALRAGARGPPGLPVVASADRRPGSATGRSSSAGVRTQGTRGGDAPAKAEPGINSEPTGGSFTDNLAVSVSAKSDRTASCQPSEVSTAADDDRPERGESESRSATKRAGGEPPRSLALIEL